jgi:F0F1-type ATP synthase assembly protein I
MKKLLKKIEEPVLDVILLTLGIIVLVAGAAFWNWSFLSYCITMLGLAICLLSISQMMMFAVRQSAGTSHRGRTSKSAKRVVIGFGILFVAFALLRAEILVDYGTKAYEVYETICSFLVWPLIIAGGLQILVSSISLHGSSQELEQLKASKKRSAVYDFALGKIDLREKYQRNNKGQ